MKAIVNAPQPSNAQELRSFLGLVNYRGKLIRNMSTLVTCGITLLIIMILYSDSQQNMWMPLDSQGCQYKISKENKGDWEARDTSEFILNQIQVLFIGSWN